MMAPRSNRRAFSLIEVVVVVLLLSVAMPPMLAVLGSAAADRADAYQTTRASALASLILETVIADVSSPDPTLGFDALADASAYTQAATTGFNDRLAGIAKPYLDAGMTYELEISALVSSSGVALGDADADIYRVVTVRVTYPSASSAAFELPVSIMVGDV